MKKNRAFLKWAGGKYALVEEIRRYLPESNVLLEPFVGAGSVFLNTDYQQYILADINRDLINLYNVVKLRSDDFVKDARFFFNSDFNQPEKYYALRAEFNLCQDDYYRALLFLYLNRHGYNGLCRYNKRGVFNVPFGRYKRPYFPEHEIYYFAHKAQQATFICEHYSQTLLKASQEAVVYCDPPYVPLSITANFTAYHMDDFSLTEQKNLAKLAEELTQRRVSVLISNHDTALTRLWYQKAQLYVIKARRTISRNTSGRGKVDELLALFRGQ